MADEEIAPAHGTPSEFRTSEMRGTRARWVIFAGTSVALTLSAIDGTVVATALPTLTRELSASVTWSAWTITAYSLGIITGLPIAGRLSDVLGRKRMFLAFISLFTVASLGCGLVGNIFVLIMLRFVQALGGAGLMPSTAGVLSDQFGSARDRPIGLMTSIFPLGAMVGPALGGLIVTYSSWRLIFFINVPLGIALILLLARLLPPDPPLGKGRLQIDLIGSGLMILAILSMMLGLNELGQVGTRSALPWAVLGLAVVFGAAFVVRQETARHPILPPSLLKQRTFVIVNGLNIIYGAAALGIFSLLPLYAQVTFGMRPLEAGGLLTIRAGTMAIVSTVTALWLIQRFGYRRPMALGFCLLALGLIVLSIRPTTLGPFLWLSVSCVICGIGIGLSGPPSNNAALQLMPSQVAAISGLRATFRQIGGILAISVSAEIISSSGQGAGVLPAVAAALALVTLAVTPAIIRVPESPMFKRRS
ncbi:MAG TPA: MFS transporter [Candidatus Acidoferrum sp.]|nr:MFS transporter [Candidatus Acidoferrum sp.]